MYMHTPHTTEADLQRELERTEGRLNAYRNDMWVLRLRLEEALKEKERLERHLSAVDTAVSASSAQSARVE